MDKQIAVVMRQLRPWCILLSVCASAISNSSAQYQQFATTNQNFSAYVIRSNGASSAHLLQVTIQTNGFIRATGRRYDFGVTNVSPSPTNGSVVSNNVLIPSRLGSPIIVKTNSFGVYTNQVQLSNGASTNMSFSNFTIETRCPAGVFLTDGSVFKGVAVKSVQTDQYWNGQQRVNSAYTNNVLYGAITFSNGFGYGGTD